MSFCKHIEVLLSKKSTLYASLRRSNAAGPLPGFNAEERDTQKASNDENTAPNRLLEWRMMRSAPGLFGRGRESVPHMDHDLKARQCEEQVR